MNVFRTAKKLSSILVRSKLYPLKRVIGSSKYNGNGCAVCMSVNETSTFASLVTHEIYKVNH